MNGKRLYRSESNRMLCGVCAGIAEYFNLDPTLIRLAWALFCVLGGSGVLGIASLLMGAESAVGVDIDDVAVRTAKENAGINGVADRFTGICGSFTDKVTGKYDIVLANIVADAIMFLSKGVKDFMKDDAVYIMSGIIDTRAEEVKESVGKDFDIIEEHLEKGWVCLAAKAKK